jgi:hypothetical protein
MSPHIVHLVRLFVAKDKRERLLFLAAKPARWGDFCDAFLHDTRSLDKAVMTRVSARNEDLTALLAQLRATVSARAYCISSIADIDDRELPLGEALRAAVGRERDTLVFCLDSQRAYYENHEGEQFVLAALR